MRRKEPILSGPGLLPNSFLAWLLVLIILQLANSTYGQSETTTESVVSESTLTIDTNYIPIQVIKLADGGKQIIRYHDKGQTKLRSESYLDRYERPTGTWTDYHENGNILMTRNYLFGDLQGIVEVLDDKGKPEVTRYYIDGELIGERSPNAGGAISISLRREKRTRFVDLTCSDGNGAKVVGSFLNGIPHGQWTFTKNGVDVKRLEFNGVGLKVGEETKFDEEGVLLSRTLHNPSDSTALLLNYHKDSTVFSELELKYGLPHGSYIEREPGRIVVNGSYERGHKHGTWTRHIGWIREEHFRQGLLLGLTDKYYNGQVKMQVLLSPDSNQLGYTSFHANGNKFEEGEEILIAGNRFSNNREGRQGIWKEYDNNGRLKSVGEYQLNRRVGLWKFFHSDGTVTEKDYSL